MQVLQHDGRFFVYKVAGNWAHPKEDGKYIDVSLGGTWEDCLKDYNEVKDFYLNPKKDQNEDSGLKDSFGTCLKDSFITDLQNLTKEERLNKFEEDYGSFWGSLTENNYLPVWSEDEKTHFMAYEASPDIVGALRPYSPVVESLEELAKWLYENKKIVLEGVELTLTKEKWSEIIEACVKGAALGVIVETDGSFYKGADDLHYYGKDCKYSFVYWLLYGVSPKEDLFLRLCACEENKNKVNNNCTKEDCPFHGEVPTDER
jgi:hypothetical protein